MHSFKRRYVQFFCLAAAGLLAGCPDRIPEPMAEPEPVALLDRLSPGWNAVEPGGETICSDGTDYRFYVRPGDPERLMVYFQGGGACWNGATCDPDLKPTYYVNLAELDLAKAHGVFAFDLPSNPFADYSVVFAPYCTGDVHLGNAVATYTAPEVEEHAEHEVTINHKGTVNAQAVLDWTSAHFLKPSTVFVTGSSAGSIPSPYYAMQIADRYPEARIVQLGDGSGGYRRSESSAAVENAWGTLDILRRSPEFADLEADDLTYEILYVGAAKGSPNIQFAAFDHAEDGTQKRYQVLSGNEVESLLPLLRANQQDIRREVDNYRSYIAGGDMHTILLRPEFYTQTVGDVSVRDWVAALADGKQVADVACTDCAAPEYVDGAAVAAE
ncbi:MAG: pectin acetylesterase-family hydrolase [Gammaproteobacteria bacterium]|nr:pectin acetylesterase-family hydrolase [Gammaproteobacteria bacterium]MDH4253122.1 pectin acetylesterase-family hydrolase [Gammaproteobacteria bacterium]MDH5308949.1 pectin acetylesterase-family hydrolase [Gammaproteobacteria bacterium]